MRRVFVLFSPCLLLASLATATVVLPIEFRQLANEAQAIVHGRVADVRSAWVDGRRAVETFITIDAAEYLKGNLGSQVTFKVPGGQLGRYRTILVGAPTFTVGDEVILFLKSDGASYPFVIGLTQGLFRVATDPSTGAQVVTPPALLALAAGASQPVVRGDPARRPVPVTEFRELVREALTPRADGFRPRRGQAERGGIR
jgi:hypothetical protein